MKSLTCSKCFREFRSADSQGNVPWHTPPGKLERTENECPGSHTLPATDEEEDARMDACSARVKEEMGAMILKLIEEFPEYSLDSMSAEVRAAQNDLASHLWNEMKPLIEAFIKGE